MPLGVPGRRQVPWQGLSKVVGSLVVSWLVLGMCSGYQARQAAEAAREQERARAKAEARRATHRFCVAETGEKTEQYDDLPSISVGAYCFGARGLFDSSQIELVWNSSLVGTQSKWYVHEGALSLHSREMNGREYTGVYRWGGNGSQANGRITWFSCYAEKCIGILESDPQRKFWVDYLRKYDADPGRYYRISLAPIE